MNLKLTGRHLGVLKALVNSDIPLTVSRIMDTAALLQHEASHVLTELIREDLVDRTTTDAGVVYTVTEEGYARWEERQPARGPRSDNGTLKPWTR